MKISKNLVKSIMIFALAAVMLIGCVATAFAANEKVTVAFDTKGGAKISNMQGAAGEALYLPRPERQGYVFAGWYNQSDNKLFLDTVFPSKNVNLYAKWDIRAAYSGFENIEAFDVPGSLPFTVRCKLTSEDAASGSTSLLYDYNTVDNATYALATVSFIDDRGFAYKFMNDVNYVLTFKYKVVSASKPGNFGVITSQDLAPWRSRIEQVNNYDKIGYSEADIGKGWQTKTIKFKPTEMKKDAEFFGFAISGCGKVYIDDILIRIDDKGAEYKGNVVEFDSNGGTFVPPVYGGFGTSVNIPEEIEKEGYNFVGWYEDPELIKEAEEVSISYANTVIYADWYIESKPQAPTQSTIGGTDKPNQDDVDDDSSQSTSSNVSNPSDEPTNTEPAGDLFSTDMIYIVIAAVGVVVVSGVVVAIVVICKSKAKKAKTEQTDEQEAK